MCVFVFEGFRPLFASSFFVFSWVKYIIEIELQNKSWLGAVATNAQS